MATPPPSLPDALLRHAARDPEEPWLFYAEGWDWPWRSWGTLARWMMDWAGRLSSRPAGSRVSFLYDGSPEAVVLDLAVQAAGLVSAPGEAEGERLEPSPPGPLSRPLTPSLTGRGGDGKVVVGGGEEWGQGEMMGMVERVQGRIGEAGRREIVVLGGSLADPVERAMMSWATVTGAAVILERTPSSRVATAAWVRPTIFHGSPAEIAALRQWAEREKPGRGIFNRRPRPPFRRLRTLLVTGAAPLSPNDISFWTEHSVQVHLFPLSR